MRKREEREKGSREWFPSYVYVRAVGGYVCVCVCRLSSCMVAGPHGGGPAWWRARLSPRQRTSQHRFHSTVGKRPRGNQLCHLLVLEARSRFAASSPQACTTERCDNDILGRVPVEHGSHQLRAFCLSWNEWMWCIVCASMQYTV